MSHASRRRRSHRQQVRAAKAGLPPGAAIYAGSAQDVAIEARLIRYSEHTFEEHALVSADEAARQADAPGVTWVNMDGLHDAAAVAALCERLGVHPLWIEDALNPTARPKVEVLDGRLLALVRVVRTVEDGTIDSEQVSIIAGTGWLLTFQERPGDVWGPVRARLAAGSRLRRLGADALLHRLLDAIVDHYFLVLEAQEKAVDALEDGVVANPGGMLPLQFLELKQELSAMRQVIWPMREAIGTLIRTEGPPITAETAPFLLDLYDHIVQTMDIVDATRERLLGVVELNVALQGQRLNEIMKVLTIVSTVFIPLSFLAGLYGMNFEWMPELGQWWAYPALLTIMAGTALAMLAGFRARRWL